MFHIIDDRRIAEHQYVDVGAVDPRMITQQLAHRVRQEYFDLEAARSRLETAANELSMFDGSQIGPEVIDSAMQTELDASLPSADTGRRPIQTNVQRSELAEIIGSEVLASIFGTVIPASRIAVKESPDQQSRGADVLGLENVDGLEEATIVLLISEVKGSTDSSSPPGVLAGMEQKLLHLATDKRALLQELIWLRDHAEDAHVLTCTKLCAAFSLGRALFELLMVPILVRSRASSGAHDCGSFEDDPVKFGRRIRFVRVIMDEDLTAIADSVYQLARERGVNGHS